jgi:hypothetical protein
MLAPIPTPALLDTEQACVRIGAPLATARTGGECLLPVITQIHICMNKPTHTHTHTHTYIYIYTHPHKATKPHNHRYRQQNIHIHTHTNKRNQETHPYPMRQAVFVMLRSHRLRKKD